MMDRQKVYDTAKAHLLAQRVKSQVPDEYDEPECQYVSTDPATGRELRCAIGCLLPDLDATKWQEGTTFVQQPQVVWDAFTAAYGPMDADDDTFLIDLQSVHDDIDPGNWDDALASVAQRYHLTP